MAEEQTDGGTGMFFKCQARVGGLAHQKQEINIDLAHEEQKPRCRHILSYMCDLGTTLHE